VDPANLRTIRDCHDRRDAASAGCHHRVTGRPLTSAPASGDIFRKNGTDNSEINATPTKTG
jgi:hypothetical protein